MRTLGNMVEYLWCSGGPILIHSVHKVSYILPFFQFRKIFQHGSFSNTCKINKGMLYSSGKTTFYCHFWKKEGNVNFCVQSEWGVVRQNVTDSPNVAKRTDPHSCRDCNVIKNSNLHNFWTSCTILLKFSVFVYLSYFLLLARIVCQQW